MYVRILTGHHIVKVRCNTEHVHIALCRLSGPGGHDCQPVACVFQIPQHIQNTRENRHQLVCIFLLERAVDSGGFLRIDRRKLSCHRQKQWLAEACRDLLEAFFLARIVTVSMLPRRNDDIVRVDQRPVKIE